MGRTRGEVSEGGEGGRDSERDVGGGVRGDGGEEVREVKRRE